MGRNIGLDMRNLKRHVGKIESTFAGPTLHLSEFHKDLLAFQARMEQRFDRVLGRGDRAPGRFDRIDGKFDRIDRELRGLRADLPKIVRRAVREARRRSGEIAVRTK
jgi:hypothetical protein